MKRSKKIINIVITTISLIFFLIFAFILEDASFGTGRPELENLILLALPCFIWFIYALNKDKKEKKKIITIYLIMYLLFLINIVFNKSRTGYTNLWIDKTILRNYNLIPLSSIKEFYISCRERELMNEFYYNIIGNMLMLTPLSLLLPLKCEKFKTTWKFLLTVLSITLFIEIVQWLTNLGSFDIDDIILNVLGASLLYSFTKIDIVSKFINYIFYKMKLKDIVANIIYYLLIIVNALVIIIYVYILYVNYTNELINTDNLYCVSDEKTYLTDIGNYHIYSECEYAGYIVKGGEFIFDDIVEFIERNDYEKYINKLHLVREEIITDVQVVYNEDDVKLIYEDTKTLKKIYLYGIDKLTFKIDGNYYDLESDLNGSRIINYTNLVELNVVRNGIRLYTGKYYNIEVCDNKYFIMPNNYYIEGYLCE